MPDIWYPDEVCLSESQARGGFRVFQTLYAVYAVYVPQLEMRARGGADYSPKVASLCLSYH